MGVEEVDDYSKLTVLMRENVQNFIINYKWENGREHCQRCLLVFWLGPLGEW